MSACVSLVSTITNGPNLAPFHSVDYVLLRTESLEGPGEPDGRRAEPELEHGVQDGLELLDLDWEAILYGHCSAE